MDQMLASPRLHRIIGSLTDELLPQVATHLDEAAHDEWTGQRRYLGLDTPAENWLSTINNDTTKEDEIMPAANPLGISDTCRRVSSQKVAGSCLRLARWAPLRVCRSSEIVK